LIGLIQRVSRASVHVHEQKTGSIGRGILLLLGIEKEDNHEHVVKMARKVAKIRIFEDENGKMNNSLQDIKGELLVVSQFTLAADTQKGNRPGFSNAAANSLSESLYNDFIQHYQNEYGVCQQGKFGANMQVALCNDGPATFYIKL